MGLSGNFLPDADAAKYLPTYMQQKYPYAAKNETKTVVYFNTNRNTVAAKQTLHSTALSGLSTTAS